MVLPPPEEGVRRGTRLQPRRPGVPRVRALFHSGLKDSEGFGGWGLLCEILTFWKGHGGVCWQSEEARQVQQ